MLILKDISLRVAGRALIENASISLPGGAKVGFVGHNGTGKTSLFRAMTGEIALETGKIVLPDRARIGQVAQEAPGGNDSLLEIVLAADTERMQLLTEAQIATDPYRIGEIHARLGDIDAHAAPARAATILSGLGFDESAMARPVSQFSGGWRMRVALACVLFSRPDLLLLDEPTNYLDLEGIIWLQDYILHYPSSILIISHDRDLLNNTVQSILHLEARKLTLWRGNYDQFERLRAETMLVQQKQAARQQEQRAHMQAFVDRFRAKATKARQAQSRLKALEKLVPATVWQEGEVKSFHFPQVERLVASPIIALSGAAVGYEVDRPVLHELNLRIDHNDRIALLGTNGNGKSTFAKLLAGRLVPQKGVLTRAPGLKAAFFAQHQLDDLYPQENALQHLRRLLPDESEARLRARLDRMGLTTEKMLTKASDLSGGEKARLLMGLACFDAPHLLILDEPTNHLDIDSRAALIEALNDFNGAIILIAHDRHLIDATVERLWLVDKGTVSPFQGDMEDYRAHILGRRFVSTHAGNKADMPAKKEEQRRLSAQKRAQIAPLRKKIQETEKQMEGLQQQLMQIDQDLSDSSLYVDNPASATRKAQKRAHIRSTLAEIEQQWLELSEQYEEFDRKN